MTIVRTRAGLVEGFEQYGITAFLGVPYAAPITPERRFRAPQLPEPWAGVRPATRLSSVCPQIPTYGPVGTAAASTLQTGTDFLTVNVRTPSVEGSAPVLVWLHGGGYAVGSANEPVLQSGAFATSGVVEVTVNYRLGVLGFLQLSDGTPAHRGLLDIIAALQWVRDNIAAFGGDPERVTLAGRSAGGFAVATLMAMPAARGLFSKAMPQSGAGVAVLSAETAAKVTRRYLAELDATEAQLSELPIERLLYAQKHICDVSYNFHDFERDGSVTMTGVPLQPVIDGSSLPEHPDLAAANGRTAPVPMMIGCTTAEYLTHATAQPEMDFALAAKLLDPRVRPLGLSGDEIVRRYREILPDHSARGIWRAVGGDLVFQNSTTHFAAAHALHQPVYKYLYGEIEPDELGAPHGAEVGEVWYRPGMDSSALPARQVVHNPERARAVHQLWVSFIAHDQPALPSGESWPTYRRDRPDVLRIRSNGMIVSPDPFAERVRCWRR